MLLQKRQVAAPVEKGDSLRGPPLRYEEPIDPVAADEREAARKPGSAR